MLDLESLFERRGFPIAHVDRKVERKTDSTRVTFNIVQGPQVVLDERRIEGNTSVDDETLLGYWSRLQSAVLGLGDDLYEVEAKGRVQGPVFEVNERLLYQHLADC